MNKGRFKSQALQNAVKLSEFIGSKAQATGIPFSLIDYPELTDWAGRCVHPETESILSFLIK